MGSLNTARDELLEAWQRLSRTREHVRGVWNDPVYRQFEREFWQPLETQMPPTFKELERLAQVIAQARQNVR